MPLLSCLSNISSPSPSGPTGNLLNLQNDQYPALLCSSQTCLLKFWQCEQTTSSRTGVQQGGELRVTPRFFQVPKVLIRDEI